MYESYFLFAIGSFRILDTNFRRPCAFAAAPCDSWCAGLPDEVFPNNWFSTHGDGQLVIYPMKARKAVFRSRWPGSGKQKLKIAPLEAVFWGWAPGLQVPSRAAEIRPDIVERVRKEFDLAEPIYNLSSWARVSSLQAWVGVLQWV